MDAVLELVWTGSYGTTTIDDICERSGVKKGSFYYFFDSKSALTAAALTRTWETQHRPQLDAIYSASVDPLVRLKNAFEMAYNKQEEKFQQCGYVLGCPLFTLGNEVSTQDQVLRDVVQKIITTEHRYVVSALREAAVRNDIVCPNPEFTAKAIIRYYEGALAEARIMNDLSLLKNMWPSVQTLLGIQQREGHLREAVVA